MSIASIPLVSIIIPVFNVAEYLRQCLDSLVCQTLEGIEIICVEDCSTDASPAILVEYERRYPQITTVWNASNLGLSVARNVGTHLAKGNYLLFVDSDDYVDPDLCRKAVACAEKEQADVVIFDYAGFTSPDDLERSRAVPSTLAALPAHDRKAVIKSPHTFAWTKLTRAELIRENGIRFPPGLTYEDVPVHWQLILKARKISLLPERLYFYRQRTGSVTGAQLRKWSQTDVLTVFDLLKQTLVEQGQYTQYKDVFLYKKLNRFFGLYNSIDPSLRPKVLELIRDRLGQDEWEYVQRADDLSGHARDFYLGLGGSISATMRLWGRERIRPLWRFVPQFAKARVKT